MTMTHVPLTLSVSLLPLVTPDIRATLRYGGRLLRSLAVLLPIKAISAMIPNVNMLLYTYLHSLPKIFPLGLFLAFVFWIFGVIFVTLFRNKFGFVSLSLCVVLQCQCSFSRRYCDLSTLPLYWQHYVETQIGTTKAQFEMIEKLYPYRNSSRQRFWYKDNCTAYGSNASWIVPPSNFNNIGWAFLTQFHMSTTEGWVLVMRYAIDSVGPDIHPIEDYHLEHSVPFIAFMSKFSIRRGAGF